MKILAVNLLRLGDVALCAPALRGLRAQRPDAEIALLLNRSCAGIKPLLPYVDRFFEFDRDDLQAGLGQAERPLFEPFDALSDLASCLARERFDLVVNFSHTRLSGYLAGFAGAPENIGLAIGDDQVARIGSRWFGVMDAQAGGFDPAAFHYGDVFAFALGLDPGGPASSLPSGLSDGVPDCLSGGLFGGLVESARGRKEAEDILGEAGAGQNALAVQALTSDAKKNWGLESYERAVELFAASRPAAPVLILGAEFERAALAPMQARLRARGVDARLAITSVEGLFSALLRSRALLAGDTAAKHFAVAAGVPCVEISIGSSDWRRTGARSEGSVILQARAPCAPCAHSRPCGQSSHACARGLLPEAIAPIAIAAYDRDLRCLAACEPLAGDVEALRAQSNKFCFFGTVPLGLPRRERIERAVARAAWKLFIDGVPAHGSERAAVAHQGAKIAAGLLDEDTDPEIARLELFGVASRARSRLRSLGKAGEPAARARLEARLALAAAAQIAFPPSAEAKRETRHLPKERAI
jgi:ADP-heptose:LPS heptosyltransferase